jgi:hypothetical protein
VYLPSNPSNYSKEFKTQLISFLGPNAILVASEATSRSFKLATPIKPADPFKPHHSSRQWMQMNDATQFDSTTQHHKIIHGKSGEKIRSNLKQANPTRPWEPTNEYNNKASASLPRNKSATNKTKEFSIKLQTLSFFTREKMTKQTKKDFAPAPQPLGLVNLLNCNKTNRNQKPSPKHIGPHPRKPENISCKTKTN